MSEIIHLQLLLATFAGWIGRKQTAIIAYLAEENPSRGYARIQGALRHLVHRFARNTIAKVLKENGIHSSPDRPTNWGTFVRSYAHLIAAADFFTQVGASRSDDLNGTGCSRTIFGQHGHGGRN